MNICDKCIGCMACYQSCPFHAIRITQDEKGFYKPVIIEGKCKLCGKCQKICPQNNQIKRNTAQKVYAAWIEDIQIRKNSTSGGIFTVLAKQVLAKKGVVFGAMFDEKFKVVHSFIEKEEDLIKMQGSKYVQSYIGESYIKVKEFLQEDKVVLFSGTACQIAGLFSYLDKDRDNKNLITVDILCHGVPSPKIFEEYKKSIVKNVEDIENIKFRYKKPSWTVFSMKIDIKNQKPYIKCTYKDPYLRGFLGDFITNEVCSQCKYVGEKRISDITIADFWGYISDNRKMRNTEKGISLVIVNTNKGKEIFDYITSEIKFTEKEIEEAKLGNQCLREPFPKNTNYDMFWRTYFEKGYEVASTKYFVPIKEKYKRKISLLFNDKAYLIPKKMRKKLIDIRTKSKGQGEKK